MEESILLMLSGYGWFKNNVYPRESQWSLMNKFGCWNALSSSALCRAIGKRATIESNPFTCKTIDPMKFRQATGQTEKDVYQSQPKHYLCRKEWGLIHPTVRFCPTCIEYGYHSVFHQLHIFPECPIHNVALEVQCKKCNSLISHQKAFNCINKEIVCIECCVTLWSLKSWDLPLFGTDIIRSLDELGAYVEHLKHQRETRRILASVNYEQISQSRGYNDLILQVWEDVFANTSETSTSKYCHQQSRPGMTESTGSLRIIKPWKIFAAIRRYIVKKHIKAHERCVRSLTLIGGAYSGCKLKKHCGCVHAHAYVMWRMLWECRISIAQLNYEQKPQSYFWSKKYYNFKYHEAQKVFATECLGSFHTLFSIAESQKEGNIFNLLTQEEMSSLEPFVKCWVIDCDQNTFHSWAEPAQIIIDCPTDRDHFDEVDRRVKCLHEFLVAPNKPARVIQVNSQQGTS